MSKTNNDRIGESFAPNDNTSCAQANASASNQKPQPQHQRQLTSRYGIPLKRNPSLSNSTTSSITNGTYPSRRSIGGSTSNGSKEKMSVDDILSSAKYAASARKTWTKEEVRHAKNVKLVKIVKKRSQSNLLEGSPSKYNFPSREECLRRLGSPVKGAKESTERLLQNKSAKRTLNNTAFVNDTEGCEQKNKKPKRMSPRLTKSGSSVSKSISPDDLDLDPPNNTGIEITATSATNFSSQPTKQSASESISKLLDTYSACLDGGKTTWEVIQLFPPLLDYLEKKGEDGTIVHGGLSQFVKSVESIKGQVMNRNSSNIDIEQNNHDKLLRIVQIQIWVRIMMWNFSQEEGWSVLKQLVGSETEREKGQSKGKGKKKKDRKKSKLEVELSPSQNFVQDLIKIFELVPYVLPPSMEFAQWLKDTLTFGYQQSIPEFGMEILDHFEVEFVSHAAGESGKIDVVVKKAQVSPSDAQSVAHQGSKLTAKGKTQQQAYFSSLASKPLNVNADGESATITSHATIAARSHRSTSTGASKTSTQSDKEADATLFKTSVSLTAAVPKRKENPFLKDSARGVYVGSHFSSKLSNISSLFREVKAPQKPKPTVVTTKRKDPPEQNNMTTASAATNPTSSTLPAAKMPSDNATSVKPSSALDFVNKKYNTSHQPFIPSETPRKRLKPLPTSRYPGINLASVNKYVADTPLQVIGETPAKQTAARSFAPRAASINLSAAAAANNNQIVGATPLQIIGETPLSKQPRNAARRFRPNSLDNVFVRHSLDMAHGSNRGSCFGLSPMPQQSNDPKPAPKDGKKKWI
ncbi:hypothetical protein ACHAWO_005030 [Cyclotella atomus]|uniref:Uncharacterized protein n=1 Tax=Cyclotella atomus TaxID=382360 RepID=A0ABD3P8G3_9STRA